MRVSKKQLQAALSILEEHDTKNKAKKVRKALGAILDGLDADGAVDQVDLIDREAYLATILWQEQDIKDALREHGVKASQENVDKVVCELDTDEMENCGHGWDEIYRAVREVFFKGVE